MRKALLALLVASCALAAANATAAPRAGSASCAKADLDLVHDGQLTIGTDNPAFDPWFAGGTPKGSKWKFNDPSTRKGYESAVAYAVAKQLGFTPAEVKWTYTPFNKAIAPGPKSFDFDINQISYSPVRAKVAAFSSSYYDVSQAVVVLKGTKIAAARSIAGLRPFKLGAQLGTTSYSYIADKIKPSKQPAVYQQNTAAVQALKNKQIDGLVVDLPTAFFISAAQVDNSKVLGQLPVPAGGEHFGLLLQKGNPLVACVDGALAKLKANGTLKRLQQQWLAKATGAPVLK